MVCKLLIAVFTYLLCIDVKSGFSYGDESYCYMKDQNPYVYFGSRTAYENVHGELFLLPGKQFDFFFYCG